MMMDARILILLKVKDECCVAVHGAFHVGIRGQPSVSQVRLEAVLVALPVTRLVSGLRSALADKSVNLLVIRGRLCDGWCQQAAAQQVMGNIHQPPRVHLQGCRNHAERIRAVYLR